MLLIPNDDFADWPTAAAAAAAGGVVTCFQLLVEPCYLSRPVLSPIGVLLPQLMRRETARRKDISAGMSADVSGLLTQSTVDGNGRSQNFDFQLLDISRRYAPNAR